MSRAEIRELNSEVDAQVAFSLYAPIAAMSLIALAGVSNQLFDDGVNFRNYLPEPIDIFDHSSSSFWAANAVFVSTLFLFGYRKKMDLDPDKRLKTLHTHSGVKATIAMGLAAGGTVAGEITMRTSTGKVDTVDMAYGVATAVAMSLHATRSFRVKRETLSRSMRAHTTQNTDNRPKSHGNMSPQYIHRSSRRRRS